MAYFKVCRICGCTLDPGEENPCEECKSYMENKRKQQEVLFSTEEEGQVKMRLKYG